MKDAINELAVGLLCGLFLGQLLKHDSSGPSPSPPAATDNSPEEPAAAVEPESPSAPDSESPAAVPIQVEEPEGKSAPIVSPDRIQVVLFTATWCGPCVSTKAAAKEACEAAGAKYIECDIDKFKAYANRWQIDSVPKILVTRDGSEYSWLQGKQERTAIATAIYNASHGERWTLDDLRAEIVEHAKTKPVANRWAIEGMTSRYHLVRDHGWPAPLVDQLTESERLWLHDATHEGCILP